MGLGRDSKRKAHADQLNTKTVNSKTGTPTIYIGNDILKSRPASACMVTQKGY